MKVRILLPLILISLFPVILNAQWAWASSFGSLGMERTWDLSVDPNDNIIVGGEFADSLLINGQNLAGFGLSDSFIVKYDSFGGLQWVKVFGSTQEDVVLEVDTDGLGNVYASGFFIGSLSCEDQTVISQGLWDAFIIKLDPQGELIWVKSFGGPLNDIAYGIAVNDCGYINVTGWFADTINFPGGTTLVSQGGSDIFNIAYNADGELLWARSAGSPGVEYGYKIANDEAGNSYITGSAGQGVVFDSETLQGNGMYVAKYNSQGVIQWLSGSNGAYVISVAVQYDVSPSQRGMVAGRLQGSGSIGSFPFSTYSGTDDIYWAEYDANTGEWLALDYYGGAGSDKARDCDYKDYPVMTGSFEQSVSISSIDYTSSGEADAFISQRPGNTIEFVPAGGTYSEAPSAVGLLSDGRVAIAGWHFGQARFGNHLIDSLSPSNQNAFIAVYSPTPSSSSDQTITPVSSIKAYPNPFTSSTTFELNYEAKTIDPLRIYNIKGQLVRRLSTEYQRTLVWDGKDDRGDDLPSGLYLVGSDTFSPCTRILKLR